MAKRACIVVSLLFICSLNAAAQAPFVLKDTNTTSLTRAGSFAFGYTPLGTKALFFASDFAHGLELWITDGTANGTALLKDINPGIKDGLGFGSPIVVSGSLAFFVADDGVSGQELWRTDGTAAETVRVKDICPGTCSSTPQSLTDFNGVLYFNADDGVNGRELWKSDGTGAGTVLVANINPGSGASNAGGFAALNGSLFFSADDGTHGVELWKLTGSTATLFADVDPASGISSSPGFLAASNGRLFFAATVGGVGGVYATDGSAPPVLLSSVAGQSPFVTIDATHTLFAANATASGTELYVSDGTPAHTNILANIAPGSASGVAAFGTVFGGILYFAGFDGTRTQVWEANASNARPFFSPNGLGADNTIGQFVATSNALYFVSSSASGDLWTTNGTIAGTHAVSSTSFAPQNLAAFGDALLFTEFFNTFEPFITRGTAATTSMVADVFPDTFSDGGQSYVATVAGGAQFLASSGADARVFGTDGTTSGTAPIVNSSGPQYSFPSNLVRLNGISYFSAVDNTFGSELWRTDGTAAGTTLVKDINPGIGSSNPQTILAVNGTLFFTADDGVHGRELWKSDGTAAGTGLVADISPGAASSFEFFSDPLFTVMGNTLFFIANDGSHGVELWKSDGTGAGTALVNDLTPGPNSSTYTKPAAVTLAGNGGTFLFFGAKNRLFKTDGTTTTQLGSVASGITNIIAFNGLAIFRASDSAGKEVWKSDGSAAGTVRLFDINPGAGNSTPVLTPNTDVAENAFFNFNGTLYFGANDGTNGIELYATNGTTASLVRDICSGGCSSTPHNFAVAGNRLFFNAKDSSGGEELWATDGTFGGTTRVADLEPGTGGSNPQSLTASGNLLYFSAFTLTGGITTYIACSDPVASFTVTGPAAAVSGASFSVGVSPRDASNGIVPCYTGSIQLTSDDPNAVLPAAFAHAAGEDVHSASVTLRGLGSHTITARDTINNAIVGVLNVTVGASPVTSTITASPTAIVANGVTTSTITVRLKDADGNNLTTGAGTLSLATTRGVLSSITNNNDGTYRATLTSGIVSGPAVVTGTLDGTAMTNSATVQFLAGSAASLDISTPSGATAGVAFTMTVTAHDSNGNVADTYGGTVHFSVNDPSFTLPANYTFQAADNGVHTFTNGVVLHTIGNRTINAADVGTPSINGVAIVTVVGATTTSLQSSANPVVAGTSITLTATVTSDALGGSPAGSVTFKDGASPLATVTLASGSAGFSTSSLGSGTHNLTATFNPSNGSFTTSTSSAIAEFVGSVAAPVIDASYDSVANKVIITFSNVPPGATGVDVLVSTNNQDFVPVGSAAVATGFVVDDQPPSNQTRLYVAHAHDGSNVPGLDSNIDPATTIAFPDDPLGTPAAIHAADIAQVRIAVDFFRATVGLLPAVYTHATIGVGDPIRGADWDETRTQLEDARGHVQRLTVVPPYADPTPLSGTPIRGQDYLDLLARLK